MAEKCAVYCQEDFVRKVLASQPDIYSKYEHLMYREMISSNPFLCFCPGVDCETIVFSNAKKPHRVTCNTCNTSFCFVCSQQYHAPASCEVIKKWLRKCADDSETANYIRYFGMNFSKLDCLVRTQKIVRSVMCRSRRMAVATISHVKRLISGGILIHLILVWPSFLLGLLGRLEDSWKRLLQLLSLQRKCRYEQSRRAQGSRTLSSLFHSLRKSSEVIEVGTSIVGTY